MDEADPRRAAREITDVGALRALTHPIRLELLEQLGLHGPLTATEAGERVGESPSSCSFHLRQLARYGFVEEAGGGRGRARPWKLTDVALRISDGDGEPVSQVAADALSALLRARAFERLETWRRTRPSYPPQWRDVASMAQQITWMTPEELDAVGRRHAGELMSLYSDRLTDPTRRPPGAVPVEMLFFTYPLAPPE